MLWLCCSLLVLWVCTRTIFGVPTVISCICKKRYPVLQQKTNSNVWCASISNPNPFTARLYLKPSSVPLVPLTLDPPVVLVDAAVFKRKRTSSVYIFVALSEKLHFICERWKGRSSYDFTLMMSIHFAGTGFWTRGARETASFSGERGWG